MCHYVLFSGCAGEHDRTPVRAAALSVARTLHLDLEDSGLFACCGARAFRDDTAPDARQLLTPLLASSGRGQEVVCLSPACRCAVARHLSDLAATEHIAASQAAPAGVRVCGFTELLASAGDFSPLLARCLSPLRVALHSICHADHNAAHRSSYDRAVAESAPELPGNTAPGHVTAPVPDTSLRTVAELTGAIVLDDVSVHGQCADREVSQGGHVCRDPDQPSPRCLCLAAGLRADALVTPCHLCFSDLNRYQRTLRYGDPARTVPVLHLAQLLGLACKVAPDRLGMHRTTVSGRKAMWQFVV